MNKSNYNLILSKVAECRQIKNFDSIDNVSVCMDRYKIFKDAIPLDYKYYKDLTKAIDSSIIRMHAEKEFIQKAPKNADDFLALNTGRMNLIQQESLRWNKYQKIVSDPSIAKRDLETSKNNPFSTLLLFLFLALMIYFIILHFKGVFIKMKYSLILKSLGEPEFASIVDKDVARSFSFRIADFNILSFFGKKDPEKGIYGFFKKKEDKTPIIEDRITYKDSKLLNLIYRHMWGFETAYQILKRDIYSEGKSKKIKDKKVTKIVSEMKEKIYEQMKKII